MKPFLLSSLSASTYSRALGIIILSCTSLSLSAEPSQTYRTGYAYDLKSNELLYSESHQETYSGETLLSSIVSYRSPDGEAFATKHSDFSQTLSCPTSSSKILGRDI